MANSAAEGIVRPVANTYVGVDNVARTVNRTYGGVLVKHFCNTLFEKFTTCSVLQMVSSSCCTNAV